MAKKSPSEGPQFPQEEQQPTQEESEELKLKRAWEKEREEKREKEKKAREGKKRERVEKEKATIEKFKSRLSPQEEPPEVPRDEKQSEEVLQQKDKPREEREGKAEREEERKPWENEEKIQNQIQKNEREIFGFPEEEQRSAGELKMLIRVAEQDFEETTNQWRQLQPKSPYEANIENERRMLISLDRESLKRQLEIKQENDPEKILKLKRQLAILDLKWEEQQHRLQAAKEKELKEARRILPLESTEKEEWQYPLEKEKKENMTEFPLESGQTEQWRYPKQKKGEIKSKDAPEKKELRRQQEIARRIDIAYQKFDEARDDAVRLEALRSGVEQSLAKYREAVRHGESALPDEELRFMRLQENIEKELARQEKESKESGKEIVPMASEKVQNALAIAIEKIESYNKTVGDEKKKIESLLNATEWLLGEIQSAIREQRWQAPEQAKRVREITRMLREKLKNI